MNFGVGDDFIFLNREDFVYFEFDKEKIIVLYILIVYNVVLEIL